MQANILKRRNQSILVNQSIGLFRAAMRQDPNKTKETKVRRQTEKQQKEQHEDSEQPRQIIQEAQLLLGDRATRKHAKDS